MHIDKQGTETVQVSNTIVLPADANLFIHHYISRES